MLGFIYPGQGSQKKGMGLELIEKYPLAKEMYDKADATLGFRVSEISFEGPSEELMKTENAQPAILAYSAIVTRLLKDSGVQPEITAGHSLGEFSALVAAEMLSFEDALKVVRKRGELMAGADPEGKGGMAAILGLEDEKVVEICKEVSKTVYAEPVNFNSPGQVVISGLKEGVREAMKALEEAGAKRVIELSVSGAFHSQLMVSAADEFAKYLEGIEFKKPICPVISNVTADLEDESNVRDLLVRQMKSPVMWVDSVKVMKSKGMTSVVEAGFGRVASGLVKKIDREIELKSWESLL